ncbi:MAG: SusC/RagA family TonB-linked outer membrane protein [Phycisphaeraceae bacterium]|nr:SusC/RagA family TonB-linked outer membrane protein [Phycisphaeraceae bacterium]
MDTNLRKLCTVMSKTAIYFVVFIYSMTMVFGTVTDAQRKSLKEITFKVDKGSYSMKELFKVIESSSEFKMAFLTEENWKELEVDIESNQWILYDFLEHLSSNSGLYFKRINETISVGKIEDPKKRKRAQYVIDQLKVSGKVTDENGEPLPGATILEEGTTNGTTTDIEGNFQLTCSEEGSLIVSFVGYQTSTIPVNNQSVINIQMALDLESLEEVVVIGYGTAKRKDLTGAIASVDMDRTRALPNINVAQSMRGTIAGVTVTDTGRPGSDPIIRIRGINSITASNDPLIVLDGVIYRGGSLSDINPGDIESIDILKDASSTAIYGSLAANGVIEITTKKGTTEKPNFSFNSYYGFADYAHIPQYLDAEKYLANRLAAEEADGGPLPFQPIEQENIDAGRSIDPFEAIRQDAPIYNGELSVSGRTGDINYLISGSYLNSKSPVAGDVFSRISGRLNLDVQATDWISIGLNSGYSVRDDGGFRANLLSTSYLSPFASLYYDDGVPRVQPADQSLGGSPIIDTELNDIDRKRKILFVNTYADVLLPLKGLSYRLNVGYTQNNYHDFQYDPSYDRDGFTSQGSGQKRYSESRNLTLENIVKFSREFGVHSLNATLMYGIYESKDEFSFLRARNIFNDALGWNALELGENYTIDTGAGQDQQISSMGRIGYIYDGKYILDASIRRDGYSAFGAGNKFGVFPAVGLSWNMIEESFIQSVPFINNLKVRLSWGKNGNRGIGRYSSLSNIDDDPTYYVFGPNSAIAQVITSMANPNLGWETTASTNFAVDFSLLSQRINGSVDFYVSHTTDLLLEQSIPNTNGFDEFLRNVGEVENKGVELSLNTVNLILGDFTWSTDIAFTHNKNKILRLTGVDIDEDGVEDDDIASGWFIGKSLGSNYDYVFDGIYQEGDDFSAIPGAAAGDIRFKDISGPDGVPDGVITPEDRRVLHNSLPNFTTGLTNTFSYKGLSLMVVFSYRDGGYSRNLTANPGTNFYDLANYLDVPFWTPENPINTHPAINYRNPLGYGFYQSRTFGRLQDVSLTYTFPKPLANKIGVQDLQVYASGKNLATWTKWQGWDPEYGRGARDPGNYGPLMKIYTLGLKVQF